LNPDKVCNFDCIYCQVDRRSEAETKFVEMDRLIAELDHMLRFVSSGEIYRDPHFADVPTPLRRLNDIAFSGDGEPTTFRNFDELMRTAADLKKQHNLPGVKMVLITNASMFHRPVVKAGLEILDQNNGEIWAKLDAGTNAYYQLVERTKIPFQQVLDNIQAAARLRPLVIQTLFMRIENEPPAAEEIAAYIDRLNEIIKAGGELKLIQIYTIARPPAESFVTPLSDLELDAIADWVKKETGLNVERFYGNREAKT
jgi:wyosine [tRNA(Phe)-imidazoG37] synthetase (radical SAM superfamily)